MDDNKDLPFKMQGPYFVEAYIQSAINMGHKKSDPELLSEAAGFYSSFEPWFFTLAELKTYGITNSLSTSTLSGRGPDISRTLAYTGNNKMEEYTLTMSQFLYPACRLMRIASEIPIQNRTASLNNFVALYKPLLTTEHLVRNLDAIKYPTTVNATTQHISLVERWRAMKDGTVPVGLYRMRDVDLWFIASAAEILGADKNGLISLDIQEKNILNEAVAVGIDLFRSKQVTTDVYKRQFKSRAERRCQSLWE